MEYKRLDTQIQEKKDELLFLETQSRVFIKRFENQINLIIQILKKYNIGILDSDNTFLDFTYLDKRPILRVYLNCLGLDKLTDRRKTNLEKVLKENKIPMPICPISNKSISLVYHDPR